MAGASVSSGMSLVASIVILAISVYLSIESSRNNTCPICPIAYNPSTKQTTLASGITQLWVTDGTDTSDPPDPSIEGIVVGKGVTLTTSGGFEIVSVAENIVEISLNNEVLITMYGNSMVAGRINPAINNAISNNQGGLFLGGTKPNIEKYGTGNQLWSILSQFVMYSMDGSYTLGEQVVAAGERGFRIRTAKNEMVITDKRLVSGAHVTPSALTANPDVNVYDNIVATQKKTVAAIPSCIAIPADQTTATQVNIIGTLPPSFPSVYRYRDVVYQKSAIVGNNACLSVADYYPVVFAFTTPAVESGLVNSLKISTCNVAAMTIQYTYYASTDCTGTSTSKSAALGTIQSADSPDEKTLYFLMSCTTSSFNSDSIID